MEDSGNSHWIPLSDLMMGLMMVFLLIATLYMMRVEQTTTLIVKEYQVTKENLQRALQETFDSNFEQWDAELLGDMTIRFNNPEVLFKTGSDKIRPKFAEILEDFIPRYTSIILSEKFKESIKEIRIEGHTSTFWANAVSKLDAYLKNMELSQSRTRSVLEFILNNERINQSDKSWLQTKLTANGLSSSKPVFKNSIIDQESSQRVEFRIITNSDEKLSNIAKSFEKNLDIR